MPFQDVALNYVIAHFVPERLRLARQLQLVAVVVCLLVFKNAANGVYGAGHEGRLHEQDGHGDSFSMGHSSPDRQGSSERPSSVQPVLL